MNKDVIYIDVDDDVTAIIGKIKSAKEKIVAVVPPKRAGTLQSAVNLRLLNRMAKADKKQLVLITSNPALIALAANSLIPVAKNLQTKPEIADIPAILVDDGDDIIDGADLPVGDHAGSIKVKDGTRTTGGTMRSAAIDSVDVEEDAPLNMEPVITSAGYVALKKPVKAGKGKVKIPNFDTFRKKLFIGIFAGILLLALLIWMFVFAPAATVIVTAATTPSPISASVKLGGTAATNFKTGIVKSAFQSQKKDEVISFEATGTKNVGEKATGTVSVENCDGSAFTIPTGTVFTANTGQQYITGSAISVGGLSGSASVCRSTGVGAGSGSGSVTAVDSGGSYNISAKSRGYSIGGLSGDIYASGSAMAGGSSKTVKVPSQADIDQAAGQLIGKSTDAEKKVLTSTFKNGEKVIDSSFTVERAPAVSLPAANTEAPDGKATLTISTTYTIQAIASADLEGYLKSSLTAQLDGANNQKIYETGINNAALSNFRNEEGSMTVAITATGQIGPKIDEAQLKEQVKGKIYGEVQSTLEEIKGIKNVDVKFSYFWVRTVPNNTNKIDIQFQVENE